MKKLLTATGAAVVLANMTLAPAFASPLTEETAPTQQQQHIVLPEGDLQLQQIILPEGEMMSDAELAQVEGELAWWVVPAALGAGGGLATTTYFCYNLPGAKCGWQQYASGTAGGAVRGVLFRR